MKIIIPFIALLSSTAFCQSVDLSTALDSCHCTGSVVIKNTSTGDIYTNNAKQAKILHKPGGSLNMITALYALENNLITNKDELKSAFQSSNSNYFITLSDQIKKKDFVTCLEQENYGEGKYKKMADEFDPEKSGLSISTTDQAEFITNFLNTETGFTDDARETFKVLFQSEETKDYTLSLVKSHLMHNGQLDQWIVGWIWQNNNYYAISAHLTFTNHYDDLPMLGPDQVIHQSLRMLNLYDAPEQKRVADSIAAVKADTNYTLKTFYSNNPNLDTRVNEIIGKMTNAQIAGQMIIPAAGRWGNSSHDIEKAIKSGKIGGLLLLKGEKEEFKGLVRKYNKMSQESGNFPLMYSADAEPSLFNSKIKNTSPVSNTNTLTSVAKSKDAAVLINKELNEIGIQYNYAPDCDLGINKAIIGNRSYGNDTKTIAKLSGAFINQSTKDQIVTTAKHFPGHGLVVGDSHLNLVVIDGEMKELDTYKRLIADSVLSIMVGHIAVKNNSTYSTDGMPASCSPKIVTDLLRKELGFSGLIITDGMGMGALKSLDNASLLAASAGCDLILMPTDILGLHRDILTKINSDEKFRKQAIESVKRILRLKICLGIMK